MTVVFPVLQVSGGSIEAFIDESSFRRAVALSTDKAIDDGFFERARVLDAALVEHRVERLRLAGGAGLLGWMKRGREIEELELKRVGQRDLSDVKALIHDAIKSSEFWSEGGDAADLLGAVEAAASFDQLVGIFLS